MASIKDYLNTSAPSSTGVHSNIDNLILEAELAKFDKTGVMYADKRPSYVGGVDPVVENIAMSPILTLKSLGDVGRKILSKTGLRNPVSHYTFGANALNILKSRNIKGTSSQFPGKPFRESFADKKIRELYGKGLPLEKSSAVSVTRDPKFLSRPHQYVGTDVGFVMDRDDMIKKGLKIEPYVEPGGMPGWGKTYNDSWKIAGTIGNYKKIHGRYPNQINPKFEFEERVRGNIPIENTKLINLIRFSRNNFLTDIDNQDLIKSLVKSNIPKIKSQTAYRELLDLNKRLTSKNWEDKVYKTGGFLHLADTRENLLKYIDELINTPTYKNSLFKP